MDEPASHTLKDALSPNTDKPHRCSYCHSVFEALRGQRSVRNFTYYFCKSCGAITYTGRELIDSKRRYRKWKRQIRRSPDGNYST